MGTKSRLILALDVYDRAKALQIAKEIGEELKAIKVNWPLILGSGSDIITELSKYSKVLCDFKVADIPNTNRLITEKVRDLGAWGIITHIFPGRDSLDSVIYAADEMRVFAVVSMSNPGSKEFIDGHLDQFSQTAAESNVYGVIAPGNKPDVLRKIRQAVGNKKIISPGIGAQGGDPTEAIKNGADWIIVGRMIYESPDPAGQAREINALLEEFEKQN